MKFLNTEISYRLIVLAYFLAMYACLVSAAFMVLKDLLNAAGFVSSVILFMILYNKRVQEESEFVREMMKKQMTRGTSDKSTKT